MSSVLMIGYGNASRRDDGVALHILRRLRAKLGLAVDDLDDEEEGEMDPELGMLVVHQLGPELAESISQYEYVIFLDAHVEGTLWEPVHWQEITPGYRPNIVTHHLKPESVLALCHSLYQRSPKGYVLSVLGTDFDFGDELSPETSARADLAVERLMVFLAEQGITLGESDVSPPG